MKKVMIGVLIVIPILILLVVAMVSTILSVQAWVAVEDLTVTINGGEDSLVLNFSELKGQKQNFYDYIDVKVYPDKANRYTIEWMISDGLVCHDLDYANRYQTYLDNKYLNEDDDPDNDIPVEHPAAMLVDDNGQEVASNTSGDFLINSYCSFSVAVQAENVRKSFSVLVVGYDVESILLVNENNELEVGESILLNPHYVPLDSVVNNATFESSDNSVATVDRNGAVTAVGEGTADIVMSTVREDGVEVKSAPYTVTVSPALCKYGNSLVTSSRNISLEDIGVNVEDIDEAASAGCSIDGQNLIVEGDSAQLALIGGKALPISICSAEDISIRHAALFDEQNGYVLAVGDIPLQLAVEYTDMLAGSAPTGVSWSSSDNSVATVDNGKVEAKNSGFVTITAATAAAAVDIRLNVQYKVTSMQLKSSTLSFEVGLAKQTVFASQRFNGSALEANSTLIVVQGEPRQKDGMSDSEHRQALEQFYSAYKFEIVEGADYAHFDPVTINRIVFDNALEGKGLQKIVAKVSAKYPKYEGMTVFTEENVDLYAIYGVEVASRAEFETATQMQEQYAKAEGNYHPSNIVQSVVDDYDGITYMVQMSDYSDRTLAITLAANILFDGDYTPGDDTHQFLYGDLYGNNNMMYSTSGLVGYVPADDEFTGRFGLLQVAWSNVTVSNVVLRTNELKDGTITDSSSASGLKGTCLVVNALADKGVNGNEYAYTKHLENVKVEYSIFENANWGMRMNNADVAMTGCVLRNMSSCSIYTATRIVPMTDTTDAYMHYGNLSVHNVVCSNSLGTFMSNVYERVTLLPDGGANRFNSDDELNRKFFVDNFASKGYASSFTQTGFLNIYNWQKAADGNLIDVGDDTYNNVIKNFAVDLIEYNPAFEQGRLWFDNQWYFHLGFVISGVSLGENIFDEPMYLTVSIEDPRFYKVHTGDIKPTDPSVSAREKFAAALISRLGLDFYGYRYDSNILPGDTYAIEINFINSLHS